MISDTIRLGFTHTDRPGYLPQTDGYRPGAIQTEIVIGPVLLPGQHHTATITLAEATAVAEACWAATNRPQGVPANVLEHEIADAFALKILELRKAEDLAHQEIRALCTGDTVTVRGMKLAATSAGWERV